MLPGRILVVEDHKETALVLNDYFRAHDLNSHVALTGMDALEKFEAERHDLLVTDYTLPDTNGIALVAACRAISPSVKVIYITAVDLRGIDPLFKTGPDCQIIGKPARPGDILELIRKML